MIKISQPQCFTALGEKPNQEDSLYPPCGKATTSTRIFMVCDGMGGHEKGEIASACVAETIGQLTDCQPPKTMSQMKETFEQALAQAYHNLDELDDEPSTKKMGTTLTFLALCTDGILVAHIGDSRVYQFRPGSGIIFQTRDHSLVNDLIASGELREEDAKTYPQRNVITRALQPHQEFSAKATYNVLTDIQPGDLFLLCCDGVLEQLDNKELSTILLCDSSLAQRMVTLEETCKTRNTRDNNTAYLLEVCNADGIGKKEVILTVAAKNEEDDEEPKTLEMRHNGRWWNIHKLWIIVSLAIMAFILAFVLFLNPFATNKESDKEQVAPQPTEHTQGYIRRQTKK